MILLFILNTFLNIISSQEIYVVTKDNNRNIDLIAINNTQYVYTVNIEIVLTGNRSQFLNEAIVIQPNSQKKITSIDKSRYDYFNYNYNFRIGNYLHSSHNKNAVYSVPFDISDNSINVIQGYNGSFSHQRIKALDFILPYGSDLFCARSGKVIKVVDFNNKGCGDESCSEFNNFILIEHSDGTIANYSHLLKNSVKVKEGMEIKAGEMIAQSGSTGWSTVPHLHFEVYEVLRNRIKSVKTRFNLGNDIVFLKEGVYKF